MCRISGAQHRNHKRHSQNKETTGCRGTERSKAELSGMSDIFWHYGICMTISTNLSTEDELRAIFHLLIYSCINVYKFAFENQATHFQLN